MAMVTLHVPWAAMKRADFRQIWLQPRMHRLDRKVPALIIRSGNQNAKQARQWGEVQGADRLSCYVKGVQFWASVPPAAAYTQVDKTRKPDVLFKGRNRCRSAWCCISASPTHSCRFTQVMPSVSVYLGPLGAWLCSVQHQPFALISTPASSNHSTKLNEASESSIIKCKIILFKRLIFYFVHTSVLPVCTCV